jgi:hypothetical protein
LHVVTQVFVFDGIGLGECPGGCFVAEAAGGELFAEFVQPGAGLRVLRTQLFDLVILPEGERDGRQ